MSGLQGILCGKCGETNTPLFINVQVQAKQQNNTDINHSVGSLVSKPPNQCDAQM